MRRPPATPRSALALVALAASGALGGFCGPDQTVIWLCLNPVTGKEDNSVYDENHYVGGVFDPCHCYDPCGPEKSCPSAVDAGEPGPGCQVADAGDDAP